GITPAFLATLARAVRPLAASAPFAQFGRRYAHVCSAGASLVKQSWNTERTHSCRSLPSRSSTASGCRVNTGNCLAVGVGVLRHMNAMQASVAHEGPVRFGLLPNPSVKRTRNGGAGLLASSASAA